MANPEFFSKQFLLVDGSEASHVESTALLDGWSRSAFGQYVVWTHPALAFARASNGSCGVICLGHIIDPDDAAAVTNQAVVKTLVAEARTSRQLEQALDRMVGRWVVIADTADDGMVVYHDSGGLKTVFRFIEPNRNTVVVGSQPELFAQIYGLERRVDLDEKYRDAQPRQWPPYVSPYDGVRQLLPNHRLSLPGGEIARYWPRTDLQPIGLEDATVYLRQYLHAALAGIAARARCAASITGGYDSRLIASVACDYDDRIEFFRFVYDGIPRHDVVLPKKVADILNVPLSVKSSASIDSAVLSVIDNNCSYLCPDPSRYEAQALGELIPDGFYLQGFYGEQFRAFYGDSLGKHPSVAACRKAMRFDDDPLTNSVLAEWLESVPDTNVSVAELLYWECRMGVWAGACVTAKEALVEILPPMNSRRLLACLLSTDIRYRRPPYELVTEVLRQKDPRLTDVPFNTTLTQQAIATVSKYSPLPWRVKKRLRLV